MKARLPHLFWRNLSSGAWLACCCIAWPAVAQTLVIENSIGMKFVRLPAGQFMMGSDESVESLRASYPLHERKRFDELVDETPKHRVTLSRPFWMGQYEVTVAQFAQFVEQAQYTPESIADGTGGYGYSAQHDQTRGDRGDAFAGRDPIYSWRNPGFMQGDDHPVVNVSWNDATAMAKWLSAKESRRYRLPTEAEWEYACLAGTSTRYAHGNDPQALLNSANVFDLDAADKWTRWREFAVRGRDGFAFTAPVGSFAPNAYGLHDMSGNVWEWVADWYSEDYYAKSAAQDPQGPTEGNVRVRRGGSWHTWPLYTRCSYRNWNSQQTRYTLVGFRLVRED